MYTFQSLYRNLDIQLPGKRVVSVHNYSFTTNDAEIAALLRKNVGRNFWEAPSSGSGEEGEPAKRGPGRPRRAVQGVRSSVVAEGDKEKEE